MIEDQYDAGYAAGLLNADDTIKCLRGLLAECIDYLDAGVDAWEVSMEMGQLADRIREALK